MGQPRPLFRLFFGLFIQTKQFLQQKYVKSIHPVYGTGIQTHVLQNVNLFPQPLDQGSGPNWFFILEILISELIYR